MGSNSITPSTSKDDSITPSTSKDSSNVVVMNESNDQELVLEKAQELLKEMSTNAKNLSEKVRSLTKKLKAGELRSEKGLSFLEMRNMMLLSYLMDVSSVTLTKSSGRTVQNLAAIRRIVESRTVMEKMKPIHFKLKYLIDKLVKATTITSRSSDDVMFLKPNPANIDLGDVEEVSEKKEKKYVPPKVSSVHYDGDEDVPVEKRKVRMMERARKRALSSSLMQELKSEFDDTPEEISEVSVGRRKINRKRLEVEAYEEDNFVRLNPTKKTRERRKEDGLLTMSSLADSVTRFGDLSALDASFGDQDGLGGDGFGGNGSRKKRLSHGKKKKNVSVKRKYLRRK